MCVVMHGAVREGGSAAEDAPPRCRPLVRGESMSDDGVVSVYSSHVDVAQARTL